MRSILVSHPHAAAVASEVARALDRHDLLSLYATGLAVAGGSVAARMFGVASGRYRVLLNRVVGELDAKRIRSLAGVEAAARFAGRLVPRRWLGGRSTYDLLFSFHDSAVARMAWPKGVRAVYAYEDAALRTFERAERAGFTRIWDLPTPHWAATERIWKEESARWPGAMGALPPLEPQWKKARKDRELTLADTVVVASRWTRESLERIGCEKRIVEVPYGFPYDRFRPKMRPQQGPFTVLSVGSQDLRKGTTYLLEAWRRAGLRDAQLRLIGRMRLSPSFLARYSGMFVHVPHLPRADLEREYQAADLLVFPTLGDGFGLVIQEAMSCGTAVLTTACGGGPECISNGVEGWIIPAGQLDALVEALRHAASHRQQVAEMGIRARQRAETYGWNHAGTQLARGLSHPQA